MMSFFDETVSLMKSSRANKHSFSSVREYYEGEPSGIYGRESGADYAMAKLESIKQSITEHAQGKKAVLSFHCKVEGPGAQEGFLAALTEALPGFEVKFANRMVKITWGDDYF